mgnify:CR=1 FL=1
MKAEHFLFAADARLKMGLSGNYMNRQFSIYLDLIRFTAALMVFVSHVPGFSGGWLWQLAGFGHEAVVVFFVLSGFVISYVVYDKKESAAKYTASRLSRIYSVVIPALLLTIVLYYLGQEINESAFDSLNEKMKEPVWTLISALIFTNQSWIATPVFSNLPYWSLGYEVLYYIFFGVMIYTKKSKRVMFLIFVCLLMGPSILLYLPIWFAGVLCFKKLKVYYLSFRLSVILYILSVLGIVIFSIGTIQSEINNFMHIILGEGFYRFLLEPAEKFSSDFVLCIFVTLHIFSSYHLTTNSNFFNIGMRLESIIKKLSSHTFSLYLFHMPMLYFIAAIFPYSSNAVVNIFCSWCIAPFAIICLSTYTENKKYKYKIFFETILNRLAIFSPDKIYKSGS